MLRSALICYGAIFEPYFQPMHLDIAELCQAPREIVRETAFVVQVQRLPVFYKQRDNLFYPVRISAHNSCFAHRPLACKHGEPEHFCHMHRSGRLYCR